MVQPTLIVASALPVAAVVFLLVAPPSGRRGDVPGRVAATVSLLGALALAGFVLPACDYENEQGGWGSGGGVSTAVPPADPNPETICNESNEHCTESTCRGEGARMLPGSDCLVCHSPGGDDEADWFSVGGTVFSDLDGSSLSQGVLVRVTDANGKVVEMTSNSAGNFYSEEDLVPPMRAEVEVGGRVEEMATEISYGGCASCHSCEDEGKVPAP
jgi:putative hemolysin